MTTTIDMLTWARKEASQNEVVAMFWGKLCDAVNVPASASAGRVYHEISTYGANTIATMFRGGEGVAYGEVAYEVCETLRGWFQDAPYNKGDVPACERFVLCKMGLKEEDLRAMASAVSGAREVSRNVEDQTPASAAALAMDGVEKLVMARLVQTCGQQVAAQLTDRAVGIIAQRLAAAAVNEVSKEVAAQIARVVAEEVAAAVGKTVVEQCGQATAQQVVRRIGQTAVEQAIEAAAKKAAQKAAEKAFARLAQKIGVEAAKKAAAQAARKAAEKAAVEAAKKAAQQAARKAAEQAVAIAVQVLGVVMIAWTIYDLAGPAKRVTIPAVTFVALLRRLHNEAAHPGVCT
jgi:uncharacterized protein YaaW (UPF0174 family)